MTRRIEPASFNMTQRIEPFSIGLKDLMLFSLKQRIELFFFTRTHRIGPFFLNMTQRIEFFLGFLHVYFFSKMMQRIEPFCLWMWRQEFWTFLEYDAKNWTLFLFDAKKWTSISLIWMTPRIVFFKQKNLNELNFLKCDSQNWTFEPCVKKKKKKDSENGTLLKWFFEMTHRIEPFFFWTFSRWLKELKSFFNMTQRIEPFVFLKMSQRIELKKKCSMNWIFSLWLEELSLF